MALHHLIYASVATGAMRLNELTQIRRSASTRNTSLGVTGMLIYTSGAFLQELEGEQRCVEQVFAAIQRDPRHTSVTQLAAGPITARSFAGWSMQFVSWTDGFTAERRTELLQAWAMSEFDPALLTGDRAHACLVELATLRRPPAPTPVLHPAVLATVSHRN